MVIWRLEWAQSDNYTKSYEVRKLPGKAVKTSVKHGQDQVKNQGPRLKTILLGTLKSGLACKAPTWGGRIKGLVAVSRLGPATQKISLSEKSSIMCALMDGYSRILG